MPWELDGEEVQKPPVADKSWGVMGWLAPDGLFFPCEHNPADMSSFWHVRKARQIMHFMYPGRLIYDPIYQTDNAQEFLHDHGWIRIDIEQVDFWGLPTQAQLDTLFDLTKRVHGYFPKDVVLKILMWRGFKFLGELSSDDAFQMWIHYVPSEQWPPEMANHDFTLMLDDVMEKLDDDIETMRVRKTLKTPGRGEK